MKSLTDSKIVRDMLRDFKQSAEADADNRTRALYILGFTRPGADQWNDKQISARGSRATYSFNQLPKFGRQVINDQWQNVPQIKYVPKGETNTDKAELLEDKMREIQAQGCAQTAYKLAIASQVNMGWGYFAFGTEYDNDDSNDQNIYIRQIPNPFQIYDDPSTREQDRSDRRYLIEVEDVPRSDFNAGNDRDYTTSDLVSIGSDYPKWASMGEDLVRIGHYWRIEYTKSSVWAHKETGEFTKEKPENVKDYDVREIKKPKVMYYKCTATECLEEREWQGAHIPFCFVEGNKNIIDGKVYYTGIYEDMVSTQVLYNYATNTAIELAESAPISPFIGDSRVFKGFEKYYDQANTKNFGYLPFNGIDENGNQLQSPQRMQNGTDLSSAVSLIQMAEQNFYGTSGIYPASLGQQSNEKSGKAIIARQKEGDVSTSNYADCFGRALQYGGIIFLDLCKKIYDGARQIQVMSEDKKTRGVKINQKYDDEKTGKPMHFDLTKGDYEVQSVIGASYSTKREEARESQIQLFQAAPQAMLPALPIIIRNMDWPGADKTAEAVERGLPPELRDPEQVEGAMKNIPPAVMQKMQQAEQIIQQLGAQLQQVQQQAGQMQQQLQDKQSENQLSAAELQLKAQSESSKTEIERAKLQLDAAKLQIERDKLQVSAYSAQAKVATEANTANVEGQQEAQEAQGSAMQAQAVIEAIGAVSQQLAVLTQTISQPITLVRDEQGNLIGAQ